LALGPRRGGQACAQTSLPQSVRSTSQFDPSVNHRPTSTPRGHSSRRSFMDADDARQPSRGGGSGALGRLAPGYFGMRFPIRGEPLLPSPTRLESTSPSPTATESIPIADRCPSEVAEVPAGIDMRTIRFTASDGTSLYGVVVGAGDLGIALASAGPFCDEIQPATYLARHGNRVLAYEYRGHGESDDSTRHPGAWTRTSGEPSPRCGAWGRPTWS
jgi:hypothetical protein